MRASDIQELLTMDQIFELLTDLGGEPVANNDNEIISLGVCHGGSSHKLYYYNNSKRFTCYTNCGSGFSVFDLVQKARGVDFVESLKFIKSRFNIESNYNPELMNQMPDLSCFDKFRGKTEYATKKVYDDKSLYQFSKIYHPGWINDGISPASMNKYGIRFNILGNQIIIPHYNRDSELVGIRVRNLSSDVLENFGKYMPLFYCRQEYPHSLGSNLYGLNIVESNIEKANRVIVFESEKACMQLDTMYPNTNTAVAICGSTLSDQQASIINSLGVEEVVIALDKEFDKVGTQDEIEYARRIRANFLRKLLAFHKVSIIWDKDNLLSEQESPSDRGKEVFEELMRNRITISD